MFEQSRQQLQGQEIIVLGLYKPWTYHKETGGDGSNYPEHSGKILDLKQARAPGINYFYNYMQPKLKSPDALAVVPSHDPEKGPGGLHQLAGRLANGCQVYDSSAALVRHTKIEKLAAGGDRSINVHLNSIHIPNPELVAGRKVLLIDDVMTSGNSLLACRQILMDAGAEAVKCVALGRTGY
ncbi:MAG: hypothetical protein JJ901_03395 [Erythrobacter sp.]|uniref:ComF family protein n=1 Tax=Erythrobacter sp. TaxID=1042 RepID=UPI001B023977|nr:phosphoribosyltransferase family protein [Erythrobacter sp.]MBO6767334.1 hypothetical protein [Erythrobacter sp.]